MSVSRATKCTYYGCSQRSILKLVCAEGNVFVVNQSYIF